MRNEAQGIAVFEEKGGRSGFVRMSAVMSEVGIQFV